MSWRDSIPARNPEPASPTRTYRRGAFTITLSKPRVAYNSGSASAYAWFAGMNRFSGGEILMRMNTAADSGEVDGSGKHIRSLDGGQSWDLANIYAVAGSHSSAEPLYLEADGTLRGGDFWRWTKVGGSPRIVDCAYQVISSTGRTYAATPHGCVVSGFGRDIGDYGTKPGISWFGEIVRISDTQWLSTILPTYKTAGVQDSYVTCECIESTDRGLTWTVVGTVSASSFGAEGMSEAVMMRLPAPDNRLMVVSRVGIGQLARAFSSDLGRTWTAGVRINPWCKAPRILRLVSTGDYVITTGGAQQIHVDVSGAPAKTGIYVASDPEALTWEAVDLLDHHNLMEPDVSLQFDADNPPTGYTAMVEVRPGRLLVSYDQAGGAYGSSSRPNRVFVVDAWIDRST